MRCKNPHCKFQTFVAVIEGDNNRVIGLKCDNCGARYSLRNDIEIKKSCKRDGYWNSVEWDLKRPT